MVTSVPLCVTAGVFIVMLFIAEGDGIGCFACTSINHSNVECEDTFNNTGKFYVEDCWASRKGRVGQFPGTQCIKMIAEDYTNGDTIIVRNCVVDDGGTNSETEIGRQSHCGWMRVLKYEQKEMRGCILSCDSDACNSAVMSSMTSNLMTSIFVIWIVYHWNSISGIITGVAS
ncbi:uncharacterized protein [Haliotis asinina]|uniref:uncharacterized protein n=1 Tax=Haliotis asinina TaxID=109174 RepID=UPI003531DB49